MDQVFLYVRPLLRWWWLIVLSTVIAASASYYATIQQPRIYQTNTTLLVGQVIQSAEVSTVDFYITEQLASSYAQIAVRQPVLQAVVDSLNLETNWQLLKEQVYVRSLPETQLLVVSVNDTIPERAQAIADEVANQLILQSPGSPQNAEKQERTAFIHGQLNDLEARIESAQARIRELEAELATALSARQIQELQSEISNLEGFINDWQTNYADLLFFLEGGNTNNLTVIEQAQFPYLVGPNVIQNVLLAAAAGFILAAGAAFLLEFLDDTIKTPDDLSSSFLPNLSLLGSIGVLEGEGYVSKLINNQDLFSPASEAYRMVRSNIQFMNIDNPPKTIMVTSSQPNEGKSTTSSNVAITMAQAELKTILIDADLRRPKAHKIFGIPNLAGLTDLLLTTEPDIDTHLRATSVENLSLIPSGPLPPNPSELLGSKRMKSLLTKLGEIADVIIIDCPPVLAVTDATVMSTKVDGVILVTRANIARRNLIRNAVKILEQVGANMLGTVLNGVSKHRSGYYYYASEYGYSLSDSHADSDPSSRFSPRQLGQLLRSPFSSSK
ncbi:MAG: polysaccharide biosynthesis tyrosine autokinase [Anaerolineae bacterium]|nr:polysaccharide biosynthesis tyrosine autokinase [Anaerolineae bacterium]